MKIMLIGSMKFAKEFIRIQKKLQDLGHEVKIPIGTDAHLKDGGFVENLADNLRWCIENDIMRRNFQEVAESDAVLVINHTRNKVEGFIGISALMELAIAHHLGKKLFLLNKLPSYNDHRWVQEVLIMQPAILNGDLKGVN